MAIPSPASLVGSRTGFQSALHRWYRTAQRPLPWRQEPSLYKTVVSELMLQQTQVATALPYFNRWLREWPDFAALAAASEARVLKLWEGLGYYSRARRLLQLAQILAARATPPRTPAEWRELPGIGPYTAAAITSITFAEPAACVDGNVVRILARLTGEGRLFRDGSAAAKFFTPLADRLIVGSQSGTHNQAMMELGATVCLRQQPRCGRCPVAEFCSAWRTGAPEKLPRFKPKVIEKKSLARAWCVHEDRLLLRRGHAQARRLASLYELPELADLGLLPQNRPLLATRRRAITRFQITETIHPVKPTAPLRRRISRTPDLEWVPLARLEQLTLSGPHRRWIAGLRRR